MLNERRGSACRGATAKELASVHWLYPVRGFASDHSRGHDRVLLSPVVVTKRFAPESAFSGRRELTNVQRRTSPERRQRIASFERRHDTAVRMAFGCRSDLARDPCIVGIAPREARERILAMRVEPRGDQDQ